MRTKNWELRNKKCRLKFFISCFLFLTSYFLLLTSHLSAQETIRVLMLETPREAFPSEDAQKFGSLNGKISVNGQTYNGNIDVKKDEKGLYFIAEIPFEKYVEGVVASEAGKYWDIEALKVQAVIVRTYAAYYKSINAGKDYHLTSTVLHQLYKGENSDPWVALAVRETEGEILTYEGTPIEAFYHSTCGGKTELPEEVWGKRKDYPYLKSVTSADESSPYASWKRKLSFEEIGKALGIKGIKGISISSLTSTGRAKTLKVLKEDSSETEIKATDLRRLLGYKELPSTMFTIESNGKEATFIGKGYGHGVGLSQWGAFEMTKQGKTYKEILQYYYAGAVLQKQWSGGQVSKLNP